MKKLDEKTISNIINEYQSGIKPKEIGNKYGIMNNSVTRILRKYGIERNQQVPISREEIRIIFEKYINGESAESIAQSLNRHSTNIYRILKKGRPEDVPVHPKFTNDKISKKLSPESKKLESPNLKYKSSNYGTFFIPTWNNLVLDGKTIATLTVEEKKTAANFLLGFYRGRGFPYPILSNEELLSEFNRLIEADIAKIFKDKSLLINNPAGLPIFKHFAPHYYEARSTYSNRPSLLDGFNGDDILFKTIENRLEQNYPIHGNMIKQGLRNSFAAFTASIFNAVVAKAIYQKYTAENDICFDYSMGFGQRLLGAMAVNHSIRYVGIDPCARSVKSNQNICNFYKENYPQFKNVEILQNGSEDYLDPKYIGQIKLAFSSPPYYDLERYEEEKTQAYTSGYENFLNNWWNSTVNNIRQLLKPDGILIINVARKIQQLELAEDMIRIVKNHGFFLQDELKLKLSRNNKFRGNHEDKYEPFFIFMKK